MSTQQSPMTEHGQFNVALILWPAIVGVYTVLTVAIGWLIWG
jgi:hypothetical protein